MKKLIFSSFVLIILLAGCGNLYSYDTQTGTIVTVSEAKNLKDDARVRLTGTLNNVWNSISSIEYYTFSDSTGSINVEIDYEEWIRSGVNPSSLGFPILVEIVGEIDRERHNGVIVVEIDVKGVRLL
jgi:uncharacterized protein (TIGR00156 family)